MHEGLEALLTIVFFASVAAFLVGMCFPGVVRKRKSILKYSALLGVGSIVAGALALPDGDAPHRAETNRDLHATIAVVEIPAEAEVPLKAPIAVGIQQPMEKSVPEKPIEASTPVAIAVVANESSPTPVANEPVDAAVVSSNEGHRIPRVKRSVVVHLSREIGYTELVALGKSIRDQDPAYERVFIEYYLPGMREGAGAWGVTHWTPDLEVRIFGNVQRFDSMTEAEARAAFASEQMEKPGVAELLEEPDFLARYEAGRAAVACELYKGTDALYAYPRNLTGSKQDAWNGASIVLDDRYQQAEDGGQDFDCAVVSKYVEKGWLEKR